MFGSSSLSHEKTGIALFFHKEIVSNAQLLLFLIFIAYMISLVNPGIFLWEMLNQMESMSSLKWKKEKKKRSGDHVFVH